uniref:Uncharacterized protein n=1 Tax=Solanum lycopersicum TaxID=4081 RepID=A0A3Q7FG84_SOLLC
MCLTHMETAFSMISKHFCLPGFPARTTRASFPACGSPVLFEALPVTQHGRRRRNCTLSCSEHCPSEWAAPTKQSFLEEAGLVPFRRPRLRALYAQSFRRTLAPPVLPRLLARS